MSVLRAIVLSVVLVSTIAVEASFSPLSTFFDIDVSTAASFYSGKSFGPGCARGGLIPDGFIPVAMNGLTMGLDNVAAVCGMCIAIHAPAPQSANPADNQGVTGEYFAYVYEVCNDCTQQSGMQLGIPGQGSSPVVWRAIPCPAKQQVSVFFDSTSAKRARFQVRGLVSPIVSLTVNGQAIKSDGAFWVYHNATYPFSIVAVTALNEQATITVPVFREYGDLSDLIVVQIGSGARNTSLSAPAAVSKLGSGEITTKSGSQIRTVSTLSQLGRQVLTINNSPIGFADPKMTDLTGADRSKIDAFMNAGVPGVTGMTGGNGVPLMSAGLPGIASMSGNANQAAPIQLNGFGQIAQPVMSGVAVAAPRASI